MKLSKEYFAPTIILMIICLAVTLALTGTYQITMPIITANAKTFADGSRTEVLPSASDGFTLVAEPYQEGISEIYAADNGSGIVITSTEKGFGGKITVMTGIDSKGQIQGIKILEHSETPGLGSKAMTKKHLSQYLGQAKITNKGDEDATNIDAVTGATISSDAVYRAVEKALHQYSKLGGVLDHE